MFYMDFCGAAAAGEQTEVRVHPGRTIRVGRAAHPEN